jgi:PPM family protein phosphatase
MKVWDIEHSALSRCGDVRTENQDDILLCQEQSQMLESLGHLYALADGMGGYEDGRLAAQLALNELTQEYYHYRHGQTQARLRRGMQQANLAVYRAAQSRNVRMGTTLTAAVIDGRRLTFGHVGDSRLYLLRSGHSTLLTRDHTAVGDMVRLGVLKPESIRSHSQRSLLNRCLGLGLFIQVDVVQIELQPNDALVLCSDGIWAYVQDHEFAELYAANLSLEHYNQALVALATERISDDNMSVLTIRLAGNGGPNDTRATHFRWPFARIKGAK